jgi:hypothetical protein
MPPLAYDTEERTTASVPATAHHPPSGWNPVIRTTPLIPTASPTTRDGPSGSWGRKRRLSSATKIGTDACAIAAMLESMCCSPQATSVIGSAAFTIPRTRHALHAPRIWASAPRAPTRAAR